MVRIDLADLLKSLGRLEEAKVKSPTVIIIWLNSFNDIYFDNLRSNPT